MDVLGIIILAMIANKILKKNQPKAPRRTPRSNPIFDNEYERGIRKQERSIGRNSREERSSYASGRSDVLTEEAIYASIQLVQEYRRVPQMQRTQLEAKMNEEIKAQFYHMFNCLWQMSEIQQLEYLTQQSRNGLYGQVGQFALRYYRR